jgi:uncharacterized membrane protein YqjE
MGDFEPSQPRPQSSGLFHSLTRLLSTIISIASTRLELLTTELQEEIQRAASLLVWGFIALLSAGVGLVFVGISIIVAYWDGARLMAAICVTIGFLVIAAVAVTVMVMKYRQAPRLLEATRAELRRDREHLDSRL